MSEEVPSSGLQCVPVPSHVPLCWVWSAVGGCYPSSGQTFHVQIRETQAGRKIRCNAESH